MKQNTEVSEDYYLLFPSFFLRQFISFLYLIKTFSIYIVDD